MVGGHLGYGSGFRSTLGALDPEGKESPCGARWCRVEQVGDQPA